MALALDEYLRSVVVAALDESIWVLKTKTADFLGCRCPSWRSEYGISLRWCDFESHDGALGVGLIRCRRRLILIYRVDGNRD